MTSKIPTIYVETDEDGEGAFVGEKELPWKWEICGHCEGHGTSSAYLGAFTREQMDDDPEFAEDYMAGRYDRACPHCEGGKVRVVDRERTPAADLEAFDAAQEDERETRAIERAERRMEMGAAGLYEDGFYGDY